MLSIIDKIDKLVKRINVWGGHSCPSPLTLALKQEPASQTQKHPAAHLPGLAHPYAVVKLGDVVLTTNLRLANPAD
jgi:hypothetical protein